MRFMFIINQNAGVGRDASAYESAVRIAFRGSGHIVEFARTVRRGHGHELAQQAAARGVDVVVAIGGDGTINEIARALVSSATLLGLIPKGSGNGFAREFGIPFSPSVAARALLRSRPLAIDVGRVNGDFFFNMAGFGLDAAVAHAFDKNESGGRRGRWPYFKLGVREYFRHRPAPMTLHHDHGELTISPLLVALANGTQYGSGARIAPHAVIHDGLLDVVVVDTVPWPRLLLALPRVFRGTTHRVKFLRTFRTQSLRVDFGQERPYHLDGEVRWARQLEVHLEPRAIRLLVPPDYSPGPLTP